jgi:lipopolysaccharide biosynthesis regulator YciM
LVRSDSTDIDTYLVLARLYRARGEVGRAIRVHQNLLLRSDLAQETKGEALLALAEDFRAGGFAARAIASFEEVLTQAPRNEAALAALVDLYDEANEDELSLRMSRRLGRVRGRRDPRAESERLLAMAQRSRSEGRDAAARKLVKRAARCDRSWAGPPLLLGDLEVDRGRSRAALRRWKAALALCEGVERGAVYQRLASAFAALDRSAEFDRMLDEALKADPGDRAARLARAERKLASADSEAAIAELRTLLEADSSDLQARVALGRILLEGGREPDALKAYGELLAVIDPGLDGGAQ